MGSGEWYPVTYVHFEEEETRAFSTKEEAQKYVQERVGWISSRRRIVRVDQEYAVEQGKPGDRVVRKTTTVETRTVVEDC